jgi:hypothetical protein
VEIKTKISFKFKLTFYFASSRFYLPEQIINLWKDESRYIYSAMSDTFTILVNWTGGDDFKVYVLKLFKETEKQFRVSKAAEKIWRKPLRAFSTHSSGWKVCSVRAKVGESKIEKFEKKDKKWKTSKQINSVGTIVIPIAIDGEA